MTQVGGPLKIQKESRVLNMQRETIVIFLQTYSDKISEGIPIGSEIDSALTGNIGKPNI